MNDFDNIVSALKRCGVHLLNVPDKVKKEATDLHISVNVPVTIFTRNNKYQVNQILSEKQIEELLIKLCGYSVYKHGDEIRNGFIVIDNKYRCGICGAAINKENTLLGYKKVTSLNIRIPREIKGAASEILEQCKVNPLYGILLVGEPSSGKTTVLKDLIINLEKRYRTSVIDERYELYTSAKCDVLLGVKKESGITQLIKNMSPQVVVCDELDENDIPAVEYAMSSGVALVASAHGDVGNVIMRPALYSLLSTNAFKTVIQLDSRSVPGRIKRIYDIEELNEIHRFNYDYRKRSLDRN
jgi:stage III sporulation protein AA